MQLVVTIILCITALATLLLSILYTVRWRKQYLNASPPQLHRETLAHIGITMVSAFPTSTKPIDRMMNEEYPKSEIILVCDMKRDFVIFAPLICRYNLIKRCHEGIEGIRALYRSRAHRFRRIVVVDMPYSEERKAEAVSRKIASYCFMLFTKGECIIERNTATRCANLIAQQPQHQLVVIESIAGARVTAESRSEDREEMPLRICFNGGLAWSNDALIYIVVAMVITAAPALLYPCWGSIALPIASTLLIVAHLLLLYISCRVVTEKGVILCYATILSNFYRYIFDIVQKKHYLYKRDQAIDKEGKHRQVRMSSLQNENTF